jgi:hypothetical protein
MIMLRSVVCLYSVVKKKPTPIDSIEAAWKFLAPWSCQLVALGSCRTEPADDDCGEVGGWVII